MSGIKPLCLYHNLHHHYASQQKLFMYHASLFLSYNLTLAISGAEHTKIVNVELDYTPERMEEEWASACYHGHYHPNTAFSLELQWLVATGYILAALVRHLSVINK